MWVVWLVVLTLVRVCSELSKLSATLQQYTRQYGYTTAATVHSKFIALGTSRGIVLVFDHFQVRGYLKAQRLPGLVRPTCVDGALVSQTISMVLGNPAEATKRRSVTALDISMDGNHLVAGHETGQVLHALCVRLGCVVC